MSIRQAADMPTTKSTGPPKNLRKRCILAWHLRDRTWIEALKKAARGRRVVLDIGGKHDQEKPIPGSARKARHVEDRVIRHGQTVERQHAEYGRDAGKQNGRLEGDDDKSRPRMIWFAANVERGSDGRHPILHHIPGQSSH